MKRHPPEAKVGLYRFRLVTKEGTTNTGMVSVEPFYGARPEVEPNDTLQDALLQDDYIFPPTMVVSMGRCNTFPGRKDEV